MREGPGHLGQAQSRNVERDPRARLLGTFPQEASGWVCREAPSPRDDCPQGNTSLYQRRLPAEVKTPKNRLANARGYHYDKTRTKKPEVM